MILNLIFLKFAYLIDINVLNLMVWLILHINCNLITL